MREIYLCELCESSAGHKFLKFLSHHMLNATMHKKSQETRFDEFA